MVRPIPLWRISKKGPTQVEDGEIGICSGENGNEHLDDIVLHSFNRLDQRLHRVPRDRRADPLATRIRGDISNTAFCSEQADRLVIYRMLSRHTGGWMDIGWPR